MWKMYKIHRIMVFWLSYENNILSVRFQTKTHFVPLCLPIVHVIFLDVMLHYRRLVKLRLTAYVFLMTYIDHAFTRKVDAIMF